MKTLLALFSSLLLVAPAYAGSWDFGLDGGINFAPQPLSQNVVLWGNLGPGPNGASTVNSGMGLYASGFVFHSLTSHLSAGLEADWYSLPVKMEGSPNFTNPSFAMFSAGTSQTVGIFPSVRYETSRWQDISIYGGFGIGYLLNYMNTSAGWNWNCSPKVGCAGWGWGNGFGLKISGGINVWITPSSAFNLETGFIDNPTIITNTVAGAMSPAQSANLSIIYLAAGFHFTM